jgi:hypothetical protein
MSDTKICQYCGATIEADAETCIMCGSPTTPPPPPTYVAPETPSVPEIIEPAFTPPPTPEYRAPQPDWSTPQPTYRAPEPAAAPSNRGLAVAVEIGAGIFGFLGIGWMIAGKLGLGIGLLVGWWILIALYVLILTVLAPFTVGLSFFGLCLLPVVPVISGLVLNNQMK